LCGVINKEATQSVMYMNGVQIYDLLNKDAELSAGKLSENNGDIGSNMIKQ
jgi:hypothetical protein